MGQAISFKDLLVNGLRREEKNAHNVPQATIYRNIEATPQGAQIFDPAWDISPGLTPAYPFPQFFQGSEVVLRCGSTTIHTVDMSVEPHVHTLLDTYDVLNPTVLKAITANGSWSFADFGSFWVLSNGLCQVFPCKWLHESRIFVQDTTTCVAVAAFQRRLITGGFNEENFWSSAWEDLWDSWIAQGLEWGYSLAAPRENFVGWTSPGSALEFLMLFRPEIAYGNLLSVTDGHSLTRPLFEDISRRVENGYMPMNFYGPVWKLHAQRDNVIVGGANGVSALVPSSNPFPTLGLEERLIEIGLMSRNSMGGKRDGTLVLDAAGELWLIEPNLRTQRLGYREFFRGMYGDDVLISYDPERMTYWISGEDRCFGLSKTGGLFEAPFKITSTGRTGGVSGQAGFNKHSGGNSVNDPNILVIETEVFDFGSRQLKTIEEVHTAITYVDTLATSMQIAIDWRFREHEAFETYGPVNVDRDGINRIILTAVEFKIRLTCADRTDIAAIHDIQVLTSTREKLNLKRRFE